MSEYTAIRAISQTLKGLLENFITDPGVNVVLKSPKEMHEDQEFGISVWLYQVTRNEFKLNQPPQRTVMNLIQRQPLPVNLHYLITPMMNDPLDEQALLGRVLQVLNDHPVLRGGELLDALAGSPDEFRVILQTPSLEQLAQVWEALQESYQASLSYLVQAVDIESGEPPEEVSPVVSRDITYTQILSNE